MSEEEKKTDNDNESDDESELTQFIVTHTRSYTRKQKLYSYTCQLPDCPFCNNEVKQSPFKGRKWCSEDARLEFKRRNRAKKAIAANRDPGALGKPTDYDDRLKKMGVFFVHAIDNSPFQRVDYCKSWEEYKARYTAPEIVKDFDTLVVVRTPLAHTLAKKVQARFQKIDNEAESNLYKLSSADRQIIHQLVSEHLDAHYKS